MTAWPYRPGVPAAGHVTDRGWWHPGPVDGCVKCSNGGRGGHGNPAAWPPPRRHFSEAIAEAA